MIRHGVVAAHCTADRRTNQNSRGYVPMGVRTNVSSHQKASIWYKNYATLTSFSQAKLGAI